MGEQKMKTDLVPSTSKSRGPVCIFENNYLGKLNPDRKMKSMILKSRHPPLDHADPEGLVCQRHPAKDNLNSFSM